jgi:hypothetical protein
MHYMRQRPSATHKPGPKPQPQARLRDVESTEMWMRATGKLEDELATVKAQLAQARAAKEKLARMVANTPPRSAPAS